MHCTARCQPIKGIKDELFCVQPSNGYIKMSENNFISSMKWQYPINWLNALHFMISEVRAYCQQGYTDKYGNHNGILWVIKCKRVQFFFAHSLKIKSFEWMWLLAYRLNNAHKSRKGKETHAHTHTHKTVNGRGGKQTVFPLCLLLCSFGFRPTKCQFRGSTDRFFGRMFLFRWAI